jgi:hypothetical protein
MDVTAKVAALEEEVGLLKGEIKTILQEVRTAVLARENPFAAGSFDFAAPFAPQGTAKNGPSFAEPAPRVVHLREPEPLAIEGPSIAAPVLAAAIAPAAAPHAVVTATPQPMESSNPAVSARWSVQTLAALMAWTQDNAQRFHQQDLGIVLSLSRYGGMMDADLESTLLKLVKALSPQQEARRASSSDFLLALRQLDAILTDPEATANNETVRRAG